MDEFKQKPVFFLLSGPPGAGKSTSGLALAPPEVKYILDYDKVRWDSASQYLEKNPGTTFEKADEAAKPVAAGHMNDKIRGALEKGESFGMEGMIWDDKTWKTAAHFGERGYEFKLAYVGLDSPQTAAQRVEKRMNQGGHTYVTGELAQTVYSSNLKTLNQNFRAVDKLDLYDNTHSPISFIASLEKGEVKKVGPGPEPAWVTKELPVIAGKIDQYRNLNQNRSQDQPGEKSEPKAQKENDQKADQNIWKQNKNPEQKNKGFKL